MHHCDDKSDEQDNEENIAAIADDLQYFLGGSQIFTDDLDTHREENVHHLNYESNEKKFSEANGVAMPVVSAKATIAAGGRFL